MLRFNYRLLEAAGDEGADGGEGGDNAAAQAARADVERRASEMGWSPKDKWRGDPNRWIDADAFVKRGEEVLPILQAHSRKSDAKIQQLENQLQKTAALLTASQESIQVLTNLNTKASRDAAKEKRRELIKAQAQARRDDNSDLEVELGEQIADQTAAIQQAEATIDEDVEDVLPLKLKKKGKATAAATSPEDNPANDPIFKAWNAENPWFGTDGRKTALAVEIGRELRQGGDTTQGRGFFDKVTAEVNKMFTQHRQATGSKVEGGGANGNGSGNGGSGGGGNGSSGKSFAELPPDAKAACDRQEAWVVGEGRAFKDKAAWRKHYVDVYFAS